MTTKGGNNLRAVTPEERQAVIMLRAAREVAAEIEKHRHDYVKSERPSSHKQLVKRKIYEASERLCNLMALAVYQLEQSLNAEFKGKLAEGLAELRGRLRNLGTDLLIEKIQKIHRDAEQVLNDEAYPLGLSARLRRAFSAILDNINALGGVSTLNEEDLELVVATAEAINRLTDVEEELGMLEPIDDEAVPHRFDIGALRG